MSGYFGPPDVILRIRDPKIAIVRLCTAKKCLMTLQVSLKVQHRSTRNFISGQYLDNENVSGDAVL